MKKQYVILLSLPILIYISQAALQAKQTLLQQTIEHNSRVFDWCFSEAVNQRMEWTWSKSDTERYRQATDCWKSQRKLTPDDLFLTVPKYLVDEGKCSISQSEDAHVEAKNGGMYATDLACNFKEQGVYAPDYLNDMKEYVIQEVGYDNLLWNFVILSFKYEGQDGWDKLRWYFGHTVLQWWFKKGDTIQTWTRFGKADLSWATTWMHTHIELRTDIGGIWQSVRYSSRIKEKKLEEKRLSGTWRWICSTWEECMNLNILYFTHYDLWDVSQNDSSPCHTADWQDSCLLQKRGRETMALTVDIRNKLWVKFWDKVVLTGDVGCEWVYTVTDELNCRFRGVNAWSNWPCTYSDWKTLTPKISNILRPWTPYYIKGDLPWKAWWACQISKLK